MKKQYYWFGLIIAGVLLAIALVGVNHVGLRHQAAESAKPLAGFPAPKFSLADLSGHKLELKNITAKNKVTLLNFWATWCPPCRAEIPEFVKFYRKYAAQGVTILAVNQREQPATVKTFVKKAGIKFPVLTDSTGKVGELYQILSIPTTFVIDRQGTIRSVIKGSTNLVTLGRKVKPLLK